ncbi:MAG: DUF4157 domain-containing protein [Acidobacteriia bacterium]|nr:DUF4157 domain-containing protein [Terriglobia bacterium]
MSQTNSQERPADLTVPAPFGREEDLDRGRGRADPNAAESAHERQNSPEVEAALSEDVPLAVREVLMSPGQRLDGAARASMEAHFGERLGEVAVHTDAKAAESARSVGARAYTVGHHIVFGAGEYRPGTPVGDALLAHEAAHVAQQGGAHGQARQDDARLEHEANAAGISFAMSLGSYATRAARGLKSGIRLQRCQVSSAQQLSPPSYFGPHSRATLATINNIMSTGASLQNWIRFGTAVTSFEDWLAAMDSAEAQEALNSVPTIIRARVNEEIDFLFLEHENDLNGQEKTFWNKFRKVL